MKEKSNKGFGIVFFIILLSIGLWPLTNDGNINIFLISVSFIFLTLGLLNSKLLTPLNKYWIKLGEILGSIISPIVMAIVYFFVLTPISLLVRTFGKDLLGLKFIKKKKTYWVEKKKNLISMKKQF